MREGTASASEPVPSLVAAARRGDRAALDRLCRRFAPVIHGILLGYVQKADADDLTQDVFETVLARLGDLRDAAAFPGWIVAIARRTALSAQRRSAPLTGMHWDDIPGLADPAHGLEAQKALAAIRSLPPAYRESLMLRLVQGMSGQEIAELTGLSPGSVRVNLHRGMTLLRAALADYREAL
ncbi:sigma-70 family RNA polymerase sigma factor [Luteimonas sp. TWI1437]|uniref:RNA polymerase sigma factor n=1 Tax=unclassified Luteimonas TaxID=2629088 RepID=UPI003209FD89